MLGHLFRTLSIVKTKKEDILYNNNNSNNNNNNNNNSNNNNNLYTGGVLTRVVFRTVINKMNK